MTEESGAYDFAIVIPCYNEQDAIDATIGALFRDLPNSDGIEVIVVNDGSTDRTPEILKDLSKTYTKLRVVDHDQNVGYGAALKTGIRLAKSDLIFITDADGTYPIDRVVELVDLCHDYDMVVGARTGENVTYSKLRAMPKFVLQLWVSWLSRQNVPDINSGFRVFRKSVAEQFFGVLSDRFSFTITITLAMLTTNRRTLFVPIDYRARIGKSKIRPIRDTLQFIMLILRTGTYFAPVRAFAPIFVALFIAAISSFIYDVFVIQNLTDKTVLLFLFSINIAMFALIADMIDKRMR